MEINIFSSARLGPWKIPFLRRLSIKPKEIIVADESLYFSCSVIKGYAAAFVIGDGMPLFS
jgi:hypothetical protein